MKMNKTGQQLLSAIESFLAGKINPDGRSMPFGAHEKGIANLTVLQLNLTPLLASIKGYCIRKLLHTVV